MELKLSTLLMILLVLLLPLSGCVGEDEKEDEEVEDSEQIQEEILFEGDDIGECSDGADNDRDGMFDCDDPNCAGAPVCKLDENQNNQTDNNTDEEVRNYTVPTIWEVVDLNNTTLTDGAIDNAKCGLIFAWPAWDSAALAYIEILRNSISENREGEIIYVWSAIYEDSVSEVIIANIHNFLFEDDKATNHGTPYIILIENGSMVRLVNHSYNNQTGCESEANIGLNSILQLDEPIPTCGDALIEVSLGESCDDGNTADGDGCSSTCQIEPQPCGDGVLDENEQCDDGNTADGDGCSSTCEQEDPCANTVCEPGWTCDNGNCMPPQDGTPCDDGDPTTVNDAYNSGMCQGQVQKILALHGGGENGYSFRQQNGMQDLIDNTPYIFDFPNSPINGGIWWNDLENKDDSITQEHASDSINYLIDYINQNGPYYGIVGYSQGAAMVMMLLEYTNLTFDRIVLYNGYSPFNDNDIVNININQSPVIFIGQQDTDFYNLGLKIKNAFSNYREIISSTAGHHLPDIYDSTFNDIINYLENGFECPQGQTDCSGECVDCESDANNCGTCGNVCTNGNICNNGQCECPQGQINCSGECVDITSDENNCGMCGSSCPGEGYVCNNGQCEYVGVTHYIEIANMEYQTLYLEIKRHDTVVWTNNDTVLHSVTSNDSHFDGNIYIGDSWSWQFNNGGSFMYYCAYHTDMYAEIVVVP